MRYHLEIKEEARQQLRALRKEQRRNIGRRLDALQTNHDLISVYAVRDRKRAYE